ncbi:hypothetical protein D0T50_01860 [Bacteroides sp. 214]|uniref:BF3164 family lipoprotein n=1 Tax=Bacteroides sp. 214 TaxID=2302935 RepID=UPI0013D7262F|nr:BF3164 family lipoprotein [Bacteroides sp. 214]NDW11632.1 hypothetical protein [Bacteroides sp. 214]
MSNTPNSFCVIAMLLLIAAFSACRQEKRVAFEFPETIQLRSQTIELDTAVFRYPFRIRIAGDRAIVMDLHNIDYYFHLFTYPEFKHLSAFGKRGNAPREMLSAENFRIQGDAVWALDANKRELSEFRFNTSRDSVILTQQITLEEKFLRPLDFAITGELFIIPDYSGKKRLNQADHAGKMVNQIGTIPSKNVNNSKLQNPALAQAWRSFIDYNPANHTIAAVTQLGEVLEILHLNDTTHITLEGFGGEPEFRLSDNYAVPTGIMGFSDIQITERYIYAVFHGRTFKEMSQQKEHIDGGKYVYVFTLTGEPVRKYVLDAFIYGIYVDEAEGIMLATDVNQDQPILKFRLR